MGERGPTGAKGKAGKAGATGKTGVTRRESNTTARRRSEIAAQVERHLDHIYKELRVQLTRMAQIQMEVDELRAKIQHIL